MPKYIRSRNENRRRMNSNRDRMDSNRIKGRRFRKRRNENRRFRRNGYEERNGYRRRYKRYNNFRNNNKSGGRIVTKEEFESKTRLHITNLNPSVSNGELKKIFETKGTLKRCGIHYDVLGKSKGTADVEYEKEEDAKKAFEEFNSI